MPSILKGEKTMSKIHLLVNKAVQLPPINELNVWAINLKTNIYLNKYPTRKIDGVYRSIIDVPENNLSNSFPNFEQGYVDYHILHGEYIELDVEIIENGEKISVTFGITHKYTEEFPEEITAWHSLSSKEKYNFFGDLLAVFKDEDEDK